MMRKIIVLTIALLFIFSSMLFGCGSKDTTNFREPLNVDNSQNHIRNITETSDYIIQNGQTEYKIVIPTNADAQTKIAAEELFALTREATQVMFSTITDDQIVEGEDKYVSLGQTKLVESAGLTIDKNKLGMDGYQLVTKGKTVFILADGYGCKHGVYDLLNDWFNYEFFFNDCYSLEKKTDVKLKNFNITEIPDIAYRAGGYRSQWDTQTIIGRYRMRIYPEFFIKVRGEIFHNSFDYLPIEEHITNHPNWYSGSADQICYTARGNQEEFDAMVAETVRVLKEELIAQPDQNLVTFSIQDNTNKCTCDECNRVSEYYNADSAVIVLFLNQVNKQINEWFELEGAPYKRDLKICFFAYFGYVTPPAKYNENTGEYEAINGIKCDDGVCALIAPIYADFTKSYDAVENEETKSAILGWRAVTGDIATWFYDTLYTSINAKFAFYNTFNGMQNRFQYAYEAGSLWMFNQGNDTTSGCQPVFGNFKAYLASKFSWNVNDDFISMQNRFFNNMYKDASSIMLKYFEEMQAHFNYIQVTYDENGDCYSGWDKPKYWPKNTLLRWREYIDQAIEAIEPLKDIDQELYSKTYTHIVTERMNLNYLLVIFYEGHLSDEDVEFYRNQFKDDVEACECLIGLDTLKQWGMA